MNVHELFKFSDWFLGYATAIQSGYLTLAQVLQHNATQAQKQPVSEPMEALRRTLAAVPLEQLTNEQIALLKNFGIEHLVGREGANFIRRTVVRSDFDPATAAKEIQDAGQSISNTISVMDQIRTSLRNLKFVSELDDHVAGRVTVRVQFKEDASISDVSDWKKWANEWNDIVRGVGMCIGESPEDTRVIGASKGSLVLILSGTAAFVSLLAVITKHLSYIVKEGLVIANAVEDLRHKKILNRTIENSLNAEKKKLADEGVKTIVSETKKALPEKINGEQEAALTKAVEKFLRFNELGGDVDFVSPPESESEDADDLPVGAREIAEIRKTIAEIRGIRNEVKLLTDQTPQDDGDDLDGDDQSEP